MLAVLGMAAVLLLGACASKWDFMCLNKFTGAKGTIEFTLVGNAIRVDKLPDDTRVDMEFLDEQGLPVPPGAQGVGVGDLVPVPAGATVVVVSGPSGTQGGCVGCRDPAPSLPMEPVGAQPYFQERWIHVETLVPDLVGSNVFGNVVFHADVRVPLHYDALDVYELVEPILIGGAGTPVPNDPSGIAVDIQLFQRVTVVPVALGGGPPSGSGGILAAAHFLRTGGLTVETMDVTSAFTSFDLWTDGHHVANDGILATSDHETAPNGWRVVRVSVPDALLDYSSTQAAIDLELRVQTPEDAAPQQLSRSLQAWK